MNAEALQAAIDEALRPGHFYVAPPGQLRFEHVADQRIAWEVFRGHLLDPAQTRATACFDAWHVYLDVDEAPAAAPLVSILWDNEARRALVTRQILIYGFEAYEHPPGTILSRPVEKWVCELVGTIDAERLQRHQRPSEPAVYVFLAVIGTSRLPITSLESPLPAYSLGQLAYLPSLDRRGATCWTDPIEMLTEALRAPLGELERAKALETALRAARGEQLPALADVLDAHAASSGLRSIDRLIRALFGHVALSPYTNFVDRLIGLLEVLATRESVGATAVADLIAGMLLSLDRHLTAFDLALFHNYGANYPDALFLDGLLKAYLRLVAAHPELLADCASDLPDAIRAKWIVRCALRQACLVRRRYEGHPVPDAPTSLGENQRVLPIPFVHVPEEQITEVRKRRKTLFQGEPLEGLLTDRAREALSASIADLAEPAALRPLGMAWFLDRPLGIGKAPGEVDRTPLLSHQAFSRSIGKRRLAELRAADWIGAEEQTRLSRAADDLHVVGVPAGELALVERAGVVSLADALKVAPDFVFLHTTGRSLADLLGWYDTSALGGLLPDLFSSTKLSRMLVVHHVPQGGVPGSPTLRIFDEQARLRAELGFSLPADGRVRFVERRGVELVERLDVLRVWAPGDEGLVEVDVRDRALALVLGA